MKNAKYIEGQEVKVMMDDILFTTIESVSINKKNVEYKLKDVNHLISEYDIRPVTEADKKFKALESDFKFDLNDRKIKYDFWKSQIPHVLPAWNYLQNFLLPYLKENGHVIQMKNMIDWTTNYNTALSCKNYYAFVIPNDKVDIVVIKSTTFVTLYVLAPYLKRYDDNILPNQGTIPKEFWQFKTYLNIYNLIVEASDDEYVINLLKVTEAIVKDFENPENCYYNIRPSYELTDNLKRFSTVLDSLDFINQELPGYEYTRALFEIMVTQKYLFGWD